MKNEPFAAVAFPNQILHHSEAFLQHAIFLAFAASLPAQTLPITYVPGFLGPTFRYDNLIVQSTNFRNAMYQDQEALAVLTGSARS